ncbi:MAG TPA: MlaD family protein [Vicinamibacterales bacterium]|nr:MlaD family protein [Vicinamibacterales bacterium]
MPRTRSLAWSELKIGIVTVFSLVMAALLVFAVGGSGGFFWQRYPLKATFPNIATVKSGTPVRVAGIEVGVVRDVKLVGYGAEIWLDVSKNTRPLITDRSVAVIGAISLLGEGAIDITPAPEGHPIPDWGYVPVGATPGSIASLSQAANDGLNETSRLLADLRAGKGTLGKLFTDESAYRDMDALMTSATRVADALQQGRGSLGRLIKDPKVYNELLASTAALNAITGKISRGEGTLGALLTDPALARSATAAAASIESVAGRLARGDGTAGKLLTDEALYTRLTATATRLDELAARLQSGQGTAGMLLQDKRLYENMSAAVTELRGLVSDIRKDPKKYLNVKVSLF